MCVRESVCVLSFSSFLLALIMCHFHTVSPSSSQYCSPDSSICGPDLFLGFWLPSCKWKGHCSVSLCSEQDKVSAILQMSLKTHNQIRFKHYFEMACFSLPCHHLSVVCNAERKDLCISISTIYDGRAPLGLFLSPEFVWLVFRYPWGWSTILGQKTGAAQRHEGPRCKLSTCLI